MKKLFLCLILLPLISNAQSQFSPDWKLHFDSAQFFWKINIAQSIHHLQQAEQIAINDLGIYDQNYFVILNDLGLAYGEARKFEKAIEVLKRKLSFQQEIYARGNIALLQTQSNLAAIVLKSGDELHARKLYKDIINQSDDSANTTIHIRSIENLSNIYEANEQYDSALLVLQNGLKIVTIDSLIEHQQTIQLNQSRVLRKQRKYSEATQLLSLLSKDIKIVSHPNLKNNVDVQLSLIDIEMGLYGKAEQDLLKIYRRLKSNSAQNQTLLLEVTNGLAYVYEKLSVYDNAMVYYQESLALCLPLHGYNSLNCMIVQSNIAGIYLKQGLIKAAISAYEEFSLGFKIYSKRNPNAYLIALNNLASAYRQNGEYKKALQQFGNVYKELEGSKQLESDLAAVVMNNLAVTYTLQGEYIKAIDYFEKVLTIKETLYGVESPLLLDIIGNLAVGYWAINKPTLALPLFKRSVALSQKEVKYIFPNLTEAEQVQFYEQHKLNFERFNTLAINYASVQPELLTYMFNHQLLLKSLTFFTTKKRNELLKDKTNNKIEVTVDLLQTKGIQLSHFYQMTLPELDQLNISTIKLENEIDSLEKSIRHFLGNEQLTEAKVNWYDIQQVLKEDEALIDLIRFRKYDIITNNNLLKDKQVSIGFTDSVYYAVLITSKETLKHPILVLLKNGNALEGRNLNYYRNTLRFDISDTISYKQYWQPFEHILKTKQKVFITADGVFHQINLNTILNNSGKYLIEKYEMHSLLNAKQLLNENKPETEPSTVVLMAPVFDYPKANLKKDYWPSDQLDDLPGSLEEVNSIFTLLKPKLAQVTLLQRQVANELNFKKVKSPSILHIATHGFFSSSLVYFNEQTKNSHLFHSGILLAPSDRKLDDFENTLSNDGILTAYDVMSLDLTHTDLVVLSACETGLGKIATSEGVYGLQRAFMQAGANDLLISLWKVDDDMTKDLMVKFYAYLTQNYSRRESFKRAQIDMLHEVGNPRYWGGFIMVSGD